MFVVVAGSRGWIDRDLLYSTLDEFIEPVLGDEPITIVSGTARGADTMGEEWAQSRDIPVLRMPANWKSYGKRAGYIRNQEMADIADHVLVFWDGHSRGSRHMIDISHQMEIPVTIVKGG